MTAPTDGKRLFFPVDKALIPAEFWSVIKPWLKGRLANQCSVLVSNPGCQQQAAHTDWDTSEFLGDEDSIKPLGVLLALMNNTSLNVWPGSHLLHTKKETLPTRIGMHVVELAAGGILLFDGRLVHGGASYSYLNARIHVYLDVPGVIRPKDATWVVFESALPYLKDSLADLI